MKVLQGQSLIDIAIQELGSAEAAFDLALLKGISITDNLVAGQELELSAVVNKTIATYYANKGLHPATGIEMATTPTVLEGIGYWAIETEFIVS